MEFLPALLKTLREDLEPFDVRDPIDLFNAPCILDSKQVAASLLIQSFLKKFEPVNSDPALADKAISRFLASNERCSRWCLPSDASLINQMRNIAYDDFSDVPSWDTLLDLGRNGPGASVGSRMANSAFEKLFLNQHTYADTALYGSYRMWAFRDRRWLSADIIRRQRVNAPNVLVQGSHLGTVPKNDTTDRTICTEPSINMFCQLALGEYINLTLATLGYDPARQPDRNRELARKGSISGDNSTIDLSDASDSISLSFCEYVLPPTLFAAISDCRSQQTKLPDGSWVPLHMVSSMGNGFTFPLETYLFSLVLRALGLEPFKRGCGVFGDDIICPGGFHSKVVQLLEQCGFTVSTTKSFTSSCLFRESCGGDYYHGKNVRGVYLRHLRGLPDRCSIFNRLARWSAFHSIPLERTLALLLPENWERYQIPFDCSDDSGIKVRKPTFYPKRGLYRFNIFMPKKHMIRIAVERTFSESLLVERGDLKFWEAYDNPVGFLICASAGLVSTELTRRTSVKNYVVTRDVSPYWCCSYQYDGQTFQFPGWLDLIKG